jgi:hypothetical protein
MTADFEGKGVSLPQFIAFKDMKKRMNLRPRNLGRLKDELITTHLLKQ